MDKKKKLQFLIDQQQIAIKELHKTKESYKAYSDLDEGSTLDPGDFSHQTVAKEAQLRLEQQLTRAENDLALLERYADESFNTIQAGALVETDSYWFLTGISLGGYDSSNSDIYCISTASPAFESLLGKKVGESFKLGETNYTIKDIG